MSTFNKVQLLEIRVKRAALLIEKQREEISGLSDNLELIKIHNEELQKYAETYKQDEKLIDDSITKSLDTLSSIEGLDIEPPEDLADLEEADNFEGGAVEDLDDKLDLNDDIF